MFFATPVMRTVARIELPSTSAAITAARFSGDSRFILTIIRERSGIASDKMEERKAGESNPYREDGSSVLSQSGTPRRKHLP